MYNWNCGTCASVHMAPMQGAYLRSRRTLGLSPTAIGRAWRKAQRLEQAHRNDLGDTDYIPIAKPLPLTVMSGNVQKNLRRMWRSPKRKSRSVPEFRANFHEAIFMPKPW